MTQHILVSKTTDGIQVAFTEPVLVPGTTGNRMKLSHDDAMLLHFRLDRYLVQQAEEDLAAVQGHSFFDRGNAQQPPAPSIEEMHQVGLQAIILEVDKYSAYAPTGPLAHDVKKAQQ